MTPREDVQEFLPLSHVMFHVLASLTARRQHGYGIIKDVEERTAGRVALEAGTLYAAIKRLLDSELIQEVAGPAVTDARRRYYGLTPLGKKVLRAEAERLSELVDLARSVRVLPPATEGGR